MPFFPGYKPSEFYEEFSMSRLASASSSLLELEGESGLSGPYLPKDD